MKLLDREHVDEGESLGALSMEEVTRGQASASSTSSSTSFSSSLMGGFSEYFFAAIAQTVGRILNTVLASLGISPHLRWGFPFSLIPLSPPT